MESLKKDLTEQREESCEYLETSPAPTSTPKRKRKEGTAKGNALTWENVRHIRGTARRLLELEHSEQKRERWEMRSKR